MHARLFLILWVALLGLGCGEQILASDDFTTPNSQAWLLEEDPFGRTFVTNGQLYIEVNQASTLQYATFRQPYTDFNVQVDVQLISGSLDSSYGILIRKQEGGAFYRFSVTGSGLFGVERRDGAGNWVNYNSSNRWERATALNTGLNAPNRLRVSAIGSIIIFSVNDAVLFRDDSFDTSLSTGTLALSAGTFGQPGVLVAFDNFVVSEP